jgi:virginiamycin B lyase
MQKLIFAAAIAVAATPLHAAQTADPDVNKLPAGPEKAIVAEVCTACHELGRIVNGSYDAAGWHNVVNMMVNAGAALTPDQIAPVTNYLIKGIPEKPFPPFKEVAGQVKVSIKEWVLPTPGTRPHDPLAAADGTVWYTGHMGSLIGHLDPKTGQIKEFHTKTPISGPHGLTMDRDGNIWYTGNFKGYIGKLDTKSGQFTEYKVGTARDPHTPLFDKNGTLWFTAQNSNMLGRLDPKTGAFKLAVVPTEHAAPYGMVFDSKGQLWFSEWQAPKLATVVNPETMELKEITLPNQGTRPRRIAIDSQDRIWISDYSRGYLGLYDTRTGATKEWPSPGGPRSQPYGITTLNDVVWYAEGNTKPNALVRFDPKTEKFQTFPIPSGGGVVRNMMPTKDGKGLVMAESGVNRVAVVTIN